MTSSRRIATRWSAPFTRWHLRHAIVLALLARIMMSMILALASAERGERPSIPAGPDTALYVIVLTVGLAAVDRRRSGASDLMANLGYSRTDLIALSAVPAMLLEIAINLLVAT